MLSGDKKFVMEALKGGLAEVDAAFFDRPGQRLPFDEGEGDEVVVTVLAGVVDRNDVWVAEVGGRAGFANEALHLFLTWNGDVFLCCMARGKTDPLGNVRRQSVAEVFDGEPYRKIRRQELPSALLDALEVKCKE